MWALGSEVLLSAFRDLSWWGCQLSHLASQVALRVENACRKGRGDKGWPFGRCFGFCFFARQEKDHFFPRAYPLGQNLVVWSHPPAREAGKVVQLCSQKGGNPAAGRCECPHWTKERGVHTDGRVTIGRKNRAAKGAGKEEGGKVKEKSPLRSSQNWISAAQREHHLTTLDEC